MAEIPDTLLQSCAESFRHFTIGFVRVEQSEGNTDVVLLGSGVLVTVGDVSAILTADHVLKRLPQHGRLGFILSDKSEKTTIDVFGIEYLPIDRGNDDDSGQGLDIGAIILSPSVASTLGARKSYYNLDRWKESILKNPPGIREGCWVVQGFVDEMTVGDANPAPYERVKGFCNYSAAGGVSECVSSGRHDYYSFPLTVQPSRDIPRGFGGCSGGGLWQILLLEKKGASWL